MVGNQVNPVMEMDYVFDLPGAKGEDADFFNFDQFEDILPKHDKQNSDPLPSNGSDIPSPNIGSDHYYS